MAAAAFVSRAEGVRFAVSSTTVSTATQTHTSGNVLWAYVGNAVGAVSVADLCGNTWYQIGTTYTESGFGVTFNQFYAYNITGCSNNVVTATASTNTHWFIAVHEASGLGTGDPLGAFSTGQGNDSVAVTGALAQTGASSIAFGGAWNVTTSGYTAGTIANVFTNGTWGSMGDGYTVTAAGITPSMVLAGGGANYGMVSAMFNYNAGGGSPAANRSLGMLGVGN